jgi:hypothetical protein
MCELRALDVVECVDDIPVQKESTIMPRRGTHYRVQSVRGVGDGYSVRLMELTPECHSGGPCNRGNCGWDSSRFRRVSRSDQQALALLRAMLNEPVASFEETPAGELVPC